MGRPGCSLCFGKLRRFDKTHPWSQCWACSSHVCRKCIQIMVVVVAHCPVCHKEPKSLEDVKPVLDAKVVNDNQIDLKVVQ